MRAYSTTCCSGRVASSSPCGRRSSRPIAASGSPSARGTSGSSRPFRLADPADAPGSSRGVARRCAEHWPTMHVIPQLLVSTILLGGIYALIAVGLTLIFGVMRVVNFAHGEFLMLGMYLAFWAFALLRLDPYVTLVLSLPLIFGFGWLSYRMVMRPVIHASHNVQVFTTVGLSIALQNVALVLWSADSQFVRTSYYTVVVRLGSAVLNLAQLIAFAVAVLCTAALFAFMRWSYTGKVMRATAH